MRRITRLLSITICLLSVLSGLAGAAAVQEKMADEHYLMGNAYYSFGLAENATREYRQAVGMNPKFSDAWNNLGLSLTAQEKYKEARDALENATQLNPQDPEGWYNLGYAYGMLGNNTEELSAYDRALQLRPNMTVAWRNIGVVRYEQGNYSGSVWALEKATTYDPETAIGWYYLGTAYEKTGNLTGASEVFKKAITMDQNLTMAKDRLAAVERNLTGDMNATHTSSPVPDKKTPLQALTGIFALFGAEGLISLRK